MRRRGDGGDETPAWRVVGCVFGRPCIHFVCRLGHGWMEIAAFGRVVEVCGVSYCDDGRIRHQIMRVLVVRQSVQ